MLLYMYQVFSSLLGHLHFFVHFFLTFMEYFFIDHPICYAGFMISEFLDKRYLSSGAHSIPRKDDEDFLASTAEKTAPNRRSRFSLPILASPQIVFALSFADFDLWNLFAIVIQFWF